MRTMNDLSIAPATFMVISHLNLVKLLTAYGAGLMFQLALAGPSFSTEYYRWIDGNGVLHITDNLHNVPPNQRPNAGRIQAPDPPRQADTNKKTGPSNKASVPMERHGSVALVQATLNNKRAVKFVVDTGASYTLISNAVAYDLGIELGANPKTMPFQTANGLINAPITNIESISIGGLEIRNLMIAIHDAVPDPEVAGLLGLNFLSNFKLDIDTQKGFLHLEKK